AVQVNRMGVVGAVAHDKPVARALLEDELALVRVRFSVYEPRVELAHAAGDLFKDKLDGLLRSGRDGIRGAEDGVIPGCFGRVNPLRTAVLTGVFHYHTEAGVANHLLSRTEHPDTGKVHLDDDIDAFARAEEDGIE